MVCGENYKFSDAEQAFINALDYNDNVGNRMSKDTHVLECAELKQLKAHIESQIEIYRKRLLHMRDSNRVYITQSWTNITSASQFHPRHKHPNSLISGVVFISDNKSGMQPPIQFHRSHDLFPLELQFDELNEFNAGAREFKPERGMLILFPSLVEHGVGRNDSGEDRISLSFNTFVRGVIGAETQLTEVELGQ